MRFRTTTPTAGASRYLSYSAIAKALRLTVCQVQHLCTYTAHGRTEEERTAAAAKQLSTDQLTLITAEDTMKRMAGYSLPERSRMIEHEHPGKSITGAQLRRLYLARGIKRKFVSQVKVIPRHNQWHREELRTELIGKIDQQLALGRRIFYLDEIIFSKLSMQKVEWSNRGSNITVDQDRVRTGYVAVCAVIEVGAGIQGLHF